MGGIFEKEYYKDDFECIDVVRWVEFFLDVLDVFLVERKVDEVIFLFDEGEVLIVDFYNGNGGVEGLSEDFIN